MTKIIILIGICFFRGTIPRLIPLFLSNFSSLVSKLAAPRSQRRHGEPPAENSNERSE
jgi:hypothetical protein